MPPQNTNRKSTNSNRQVQRQSPSPRTKRRKQSKKRGGMTILDDEDGVTMATVEEDMPMPVRPPKKPAEISMENFAAAVARKKIEGLKAEFKEIQAFQPPDISSTAFFAAGTSKNRYDNVVCLDRTRVILNYQVPPESDYIHANWVDSSFVKLNNRYICTQGPLDNTINDFWRMVWQEKVRHIAMLCSIVEMGKPKCAQYYPTQLEEIRVYGTIIVTNKRNLTALNEKIYESTLFEVVAEGQEIPIQVILMRWLNWPDFGIPQSGMGMLRIMKTISNAKDTTAILHCSAGIGRTGTLMACELCLKIMLSGKELNVPEVIKELRTQRAGSIQTESQYIYLHRALSEYVHAKKLAKEDLAKFFVAFADYRRSLVKTETPKPEEKKIQFPVSIEPQQNL